MQGHAALARRSGIVFSARQNRDPMSPINWSSAGERDGLPGVASTPHPVWRQLPRAIGQRVVKVLSGSGLSVCVALCLYSAFLAKVGYERPAPT